jgi:hypothetical protein
MPAVGERALNIVRCSTHQAAKLDIKGQCTELPLRAGAIRFAGSGAEATGHTGRVPSHVGTAPSYKNHEKGQVRIRGQVGEGVAYAAARDFPVQ